MLNRIPVTVGGNKTDRALSGLSPVLGSANRILMTVGGNKADEEGKCLHGSVRDDRSQPED